MKTIFLHGLFSAFLAGLAALIYNTVYSRAFESDFSAIINPFGIFASSIFGCMIASVGYYFFARRIKTHTDVWFNAIFLLLTFATLISVFSLTLPFTIKTPELFIGLSVPMHFFPILFWLSTKPLFDYNKPIRK